MWAFFLEEYELNPFTLNHIYASVGVIFTYEITKVMNPFFNTIIVYK